MTNSSRNPKIISTNNPCKIKPTITGNYSSLEQTVRVKVSPTTTVKKTPKRPVNFTRTPTIAPSIRVAATSSSCSEPTSCSSSHSPITPSNNRHPNQHVFNQIQNHHKNQTYHHNQNQYPPQYQSSNSNHNRLTQSIPSQTHPSSPIFNPTASDRLPNIQHQIRNSQSSAHPNHLPPQIQNSTPQNTLPQFSRSQSALANHATLTPRLRTPHLNHPNQLAEDQFDSARVNRKILDLEISNASLLAINGALERTKVNQQNEIRTIKKKLKQYEPTTTSNNHNDENSQGSSSSNQNTKTSSNSTKRTKKGSAAEEEEEEEGEEEDGVLSLDRLIDEDAEFGNLIQSIDHLISTATNAIHFQPLLNTSPPDTITATTKLQPHPIGKSKVLNPIQAQRFLSNLHSNDHLGDLQDENSAHDNDHDDDPDPLF